MVDRDPYARCWNKRVREGSRFCDAHQDFPNFSVLTREWIKKCQDVGSPLLEVDFMAYVRAAYPHATYELPQIYDFQKFVASFANAEARCERARTRSPKRSSKVQ